MYGSAHTGGQQLAEMSGGSARELHGRLSRRGIDHTHIAPEDALGYACSKRLRTSFLGRKALCIGCGALFAPFRLLLFDLGEDPVAETVAMPFQGTFDTTNIDKIASDSTIMLTGTPVRIAGGISRQDALYAVGEKPKRRNG